MIRLKSEKDMRQLRVSGKILGEVLNTLQQNAREGTYVSSLDSFARELLKRYKATSAFFGYRPDHTSKAYPAAICASLNNVVVHGIPTRKMLKDGDLLKIDIGVNYKGYITDGAITVPIGKISKDAKRIMDATKRALAEAVRECRIGKRLGDIGYAIETIAKKNKCSVIRGLTGHGVGFELHEDPTVFNFGKKGTGMVLEEGLVIAIEPMFSVGSPDIIQLQDESYGTSDGSLSAHFEHTVAITENGPEVLTK
jgi:methionyl aminopeptidase